MNYFCDREEPGKNIDLTWFLETIGSGYPEDGARIIMTAAAFLKVKRDYASRNVCETELRNRIVDYAVKLSDGASERQARGNLAYNLLADVMDYIDSYCDLDCGGAR